MPVKILPHSNAGSLGTMSGKKIGTPARREEDIPGTLDFRKKFKCRPDILHGIG